MSATRPIVESREVEVEASRAEAFAAIERIGGANGWYYADGLWRLRAFVDGLVGGSGGRRGRRDPLRLVPGDRVDWWRVEAVEPGRRVRLAAEMRLPGRAWLELEVRAGGRRSIIRQTTVFAPAGVAGRVYWYALRPLHGLVFHGMLRNLARTVTTRR